MLTKILTFYALTLSLAALIGMSKAEEHSMLGEATVSVEFMDMVWTGDRNSVISAGFKSFYFSENENPRGNSIHDQEILIDLGASYTIASAFIGNRYYDDGVSKRIGNTYIFVGDDAAAFSDNLTLGTS